MNNRKNFKDALVIGIIVVLAFTYFGDIFATVVI